MSRDRCGGCQSADLETFLDLGTSPLADRFPKTADEPEPRYPLQMAVCTRCWLVQLLGLVPDAELFGADYGFYSSSSPSLVAYHAEYANWAMDRFWEQAKRFTVEIACNDGNLLRFFKAAGCRTLGIDPAAGPATVARERGMEVLAEPFDHTVARSIRAEYGEAGLVIANNVVAHVADLDDFFGGLSRLLAGDGVAVLEFQYLADLLVGNQFDHVYHEHRYYFSLTALAPIVERHGLRICYVMETPAQGGSLRVTLAHRDPRDSDDTPLFLRHESWLENVSAYRSMQGRVDRTCSLLSDLIIGEIGKGRTLAGYAASAKSTTLLNYMRLGPDYLAYVVDTTPHKIGRLTPGTHIPIVAPSEQLHPDAYLLLCWNYLSGVLRREREFIDRGGRFIVPIPMPVIL